MYMCFRVSDFVFKVFVCMYVLYVYVFVLFVSVIDHQKALRIMFFIINDTIMCIIIIYIYMILYHQERFLLLYVAYQKYNTFHKIYKYLV
jgi:hypothetical protein